MFWLLFYYIIFILCIVPFEWFSYFRCHYVAKKNYFKFWAACLTTWSSGTEHCHGKSNLEKLGCCNVVYKKHDLQLNSRSGKWNQCFCYKINNGESWYSSCEKSWVPAHNQSLADKKKKESYLGLCVTRQLIWRPMPKLFITVNWYIYSPSIYLKHKKYATLNNSLRNHTTGSSTKRSSNRSIILCILQKEACLMMSWIILCLWEFFMRQGHRTQR